MSADYQLGIFLGTMPPEAKHLCSGPLGGERHPDWTVWRCGVDGQAWRLEPDTVDYGHDWQPGDVRRPVWRRFPEQDAHPNSAEARLGARKPVPPPAPTSPATVQPPRG
jgi:hypothetical protein